MKKLLYTLMVMLIMLSSCSKDSEMMESEVNQEPMDSAAPTHNKLSTGNKVNSTLWNFMPTVTGMESQN